MKEAHLERLVHVVSLGCPKNQVDTEYLLAELIDKGYGITHDPASASFIVINTCAFIEPAVSESLDVIFELSQLKASHPLLKIVVAGCLVSRYGKDLVSELPEVDLFVTPSRFSDLVNQLDKMVSTRFLEGPFSTCWPEPHSRILTHTLSSAYLRISDGCSNCCNYCTIPMIRGPLRSRPIDAILEEACNLASLGVKELVIVAQDTTAYGKDLSAEDNIINLLKRLNQVEGISWIRLMYTYPSGVNRALLETMASLSKVVPYIDMPLQHVAKPVLEAMGRPGSYDIFRKKIDLIREIMPEAALRTSFIVGHPGEREEDFQELLDFVRETRLDWVGCFTYWPEEGTVSAAMEGHIPDSIKKRRQNELMSLQKEQSRARLSSFKKTTHEVLLEWPGEDAGYLFKGRMKTQAPEVDGHVNITAGTGNIGEMVLVHMTGSDDYNLVGEIVEL